MFKSAFNSSKVNGCVRATLLGRYYALRVIKACDTTYVDENGCKVSTNVLSETAQAQIIALGLVCDYRAMMEALGESSDGISIANVKERFKTLYSAWQESVRLESRVDGSNVQSTFDAYVKAFDGHVSEMGDAIVALLGKETSFKQGKLFPVPAIWDLLGCKQPKWKPSKTRTERKNGSPASSWTSLGNLLWFTRLSHFGTRSHVLSSLPHSPPPATRKSRGPSSWDSRQVLAGL